MIRSADFARILYVPAGGVNVTDAFVPNPMKSCDTPSPFSCGQKYFPPQLVEFCAAVPETVYVPWKTGLITAPWKFCSLVSVQPSNAVILTDENSNGLTSSAASALKYSNPPFGNSYGRVASVLQTLTSSMTEVLSVPTCSGANFSRYVVPAARSLAVKRNSVNTKSSTKKFSVRKR